MSGSLFAHLFHLAARFNRFSFVFPAALFPAFVVCGPLIAHGEELTVSANFTAQQAVAPNARIELKLNRRPFEGEGRIAVLIGLLDVTALLDAQESLFSYTPRLPLPAGDSEVAVFLIAADLRWREIARLPLRVEDPATISAATAATGTATTSASNGGTSSADQQAARPKKRWGFEKVQIVPAATISLKSQVAEGHFPSTSRPERTTFTDAALQSALGVSLSRGDINLQTRFDVVGSSFQREALRFGELGARAPQIDLSSYQILTQLGAQLGAASISLGRVSFGSQRHLINNFSSRGLAVTIPFSKRFDFSVAAMNGTNIVGWSNFFGLNRSKHRIISGAIGFEIDPERRGARRIEFGVSHGSVQPLNNFNQQTITDAERSTGASLRLLWSDKSQRFKFDAGVSRSRFINPADSLLARGVNLVPVRDESRNADYLDASFVVLRDYQLTAQKKANLIFNLRHERIEPFYRSIGAIIQADRFQNQFELAGSIGDFTVAAGHLRSHDNLDQIRSVLETLTRRDNFIIGGPLQTLFKQASQPSPWWPRISYVFDHVHQLGASLPINADFRPDLVPDQISANHNFTAAWQLGKWQASYRFNRSFQDNRQPGRERADLLNRINGITLGTSPRPFFDLNFDVNLEQAKNFETLRLDRTLRFAVITNWRMMSRSTLSVNISTIGAGDRALTSHSRTIEADAQWSYRFGYEQTRWKKFQGQFFIRYANRYAHSFDRTFLFNNLIKTWTANLGLSFTY